MNIQSKVYFSYLICILFCIFLFPCLVFSQEQITITSYYPSPYGVYDELETNKFVVGGGVMPQDDGVVNFETLSSDPGTSDEGGLYYNSSDNEFKYHDGSAWQSLKPPSGCLRRQYTSTSDTITCPVGYQLAGVVYSATIPGTGRYLCCSYCDDFNNDGACD